MKFGTVIPCKVTKKFVGKRLQNCSYSDDDVTNYVNFLKNYATKQTKYRKRNKISSPCVE